MPRIALAGTLALAFTACTAASAQVWVSDTIGGEPGIRYEGSNFGIVISCNEFSNMDVVLITDKDQFGQHGEWGNFLDMGNMALLKDRDPIVIRNAYREKDMAHLAIFTAIFFDEHIRQAASASDSITFGLLETEDDMSFLATAGLDGFRSNSEDLISECNEKYVD